MGNVQCGPPTTATFDPDFDLVLDTRQSGRTIEAVGCTIYHKSADNNETTFLQVHQTDYAQKCILDQNDVVSALVEQAVALFLREKDQAAISSLPTYSASVLDDTDGDRSDVSSTKLSRVLSVGAKSEVTTMSTATEQIANRKIRKKQRRRQTAALDPPQLKGGEEFKALESIHSRVQQALHPPHIPLPIALAEKNTIACLSPYFADQPETVDSATVRKYTSALHLRLDAYCGRYYLKQVSEAGLQGPVAKAIAGSIISTDLCATGDAARRLDVPNLTMSDSSSSGEIEFGPCPPCSPVRLLVTETVFMDLSLTGSLGLVDRRRSRSYTYSPGRKHLKSPDHYVVLINRRSGAPIALCALKATHSGSPIVRIFATKRRIMGQKPAATTRRLGLNWCNSFPLFPWAEIVTEGEYPGRVRYSIFMASASEGRFEDAPSYRALHDSTLSPEIKVVGRTEREERYSGCATLSICCEDNSYLNLFMKLSISKGIDPALLICFAAFVDELLEQTLRQEFQPRAGDV